MKKVTIHAGMHKSGTSSIQQALKNYTGKEILYPKLGNPNHSQAISAAFDGKNITYAGFKHLSSVEIKELSRKTKLELESSFKKHNNIVISGEDIGLMTPQGVNAMLKYFRKRADYIQVIFYLRNPESFVSSAFQEYLKQGMDSLPSEINPRYKLRIKKFANNNLLDKITIREFSANQLTEGCVVTDFFKLLGINKSQNSEPPTNESLSGIALKILWKFNTRLKQKPEDRTCYQARLLLNSVVKKLYRTSEKIDKSLFGYLAQTDDLEYLAEDLKFRFRSNFHLDNRTQERFNESSMVLRDYLDDIEFRELAPMLNWLREKDTSSNPSDIDSLINRVFIECIKINALKQKC